MVSMHNKKWLARIGLTLLLLLTGHALAGQDQQNIGFTLDQAYETALKKNEHVAISREELRQNRSEITIATSNLYPQISAVAAYNREKDIQITADGQDLGTFGNPDEYGTLTIRLDQHIYQFGKVWSGRKMAQYYFKSSKFRHVRRLKEILFNVSTRYYEALLGRRAIEISENALQRANRQMEQANARFEVGVLTQTDVLRAQVQVAQSQEQLERARNQYDIALENLALELGTEAVPAELAEPLEKNIKPAPVPDLYQKALTHRQDLREAENRVSAAEKRVDFEQADFFPNLSVEGLYIRTEEPDMFFDERDDWQAALKLSYPLFTGGKTSAEVGKAKSELDQAKAAMARLKKEIRNQVRSVYLDIQTQKKVIQQLEEQVKTAKRNYRQVTAQFEQGVVTAVDQVDAFTALNEAENRLAQAYYSYQLDQIRLELAMGTFQTDLLVKELSNDRAY